MCIIGSEDPVHVAQANARLAKFGYLRIWNVAMGGSGQFNAASSQVLGPGDGRFQDEKRELCQNHRHKLLYFIALTELPRFRLDQSGK
ncbi:hypothetical protein N7535_007427 [Penicillium sp. DV-2018c]|nr:hypothetical protein N7461_003455 [Penicillium sp. DV-2018c]KAJ5565789.1 hypothetical protein N7535_007427 [Penicillium sp. DV-2018c]